MGGRFGETEVLGQWGRGKPQLAERGGALGLLPLHISERRLRGPLSVPAAVSHDVEQVTPVLGTPPTLWSGFSHRTGLGAGEVGVLPFYRKGSPGLKDAK